MQLASDAPLPEYRIRGVPEIARLALAAFRALVAMADSLLNCCWQVRDARIHDRAVPPHLDIGIIQERHHAIDWVIGYDGMPLDEVATDT